MRRPHSRAKGVSITCPERSALHAGGQASRTGHTKVANEICAPSGRTRGQVNKRRAEVEKGKRGGGVTTGSFSRSSSVLSRSSAYAWMREKAEAEALL